MFQTSDHILTRNLPPTLQCKVYEELGVVLFDLSTLSVKFLVMKSSV